VTLRHPVSAPGKAFLIGEYAVLEGVPALVTAVEVRAVAHDCDRPDRPAPSDLSLAAHAAVRDHLSSGTAAPIGELPSVDTGPFTAASASSASARAPPSPPPSSASTSRGRPRPQHAPTPAPSPSPRPRRPPPGPGRRQRRRRRRRGARRQPLFTRDGAPPPSPHPTWLHVGFVDVGAPADHQPASSPGPTAAAADPSAYNARSTSSPPRASDFLAGPDADARSPAFAAIVRRSERHNDGLARPASALSGAPILTPSITAVLTRPRPRARPRRQTHRRRRRRPRRRLRRPARAELDASAIASVASTADFPQRSQRRRPRPARGAAPSAPLAPRRLLQARIAGRRAAVAEAAGLPLADFSALDPGSLASSSAEHMIENVIGTLALPIAVATNFRINGVDSWSPWRRGGLGRRRRLQRRQDDPRRRRLHRPRRSAVDDRPGSSSAAAPRAARSTTRSARSWPKRQLCSPRRRAHPRLVARGGGARELEVRVLAADMLVVHAIVDCQDAMGANLLNTIAEAARPAPRRPHRLDPGPADPQQPRRSPLRPRPLPDPPRSARRQRLARRGRRRRIVSASRFAELDPYRAATHNKGVMNGVDAVVLATGNDWRAMEAGAHAYAARVGATAPSPPGRVGADGWLEGVDQPARRRRHRRRRHQGPSRRPPRPADPRPAQRLAELGQVMAARRPRLQPRGPPRARDRGHPARPHVAARPLRRRRRRRQSARDRPARPPPHRLGEIKHERALALLQELRAEAASEPLCAPPPCAPSPAQIPDPR
jgi:hypothetical protein